MQGCEHDVALAAKLPAVVRGEAQPSSAHERLVYGRLCWYRGLYGASVRLCSDAFAADPKLAEDLSTDDRYYAARYAVLAAGGQGEDAKQAAKEERDRWRRQSLDWLQTDLARWTKRLEDGDAKTQLTVERTMRRWRIDPALAVVRDADKPATLPEAERESWRKLWADVDDLIQRASGAGQRAIVGPSFPPAHGRRQNNSRADVTSFPARRSLLRSRVKRRGRAPDKSPRRQEGVSHASLVRHRRRPRRRRFAFRERRLGRDAGRRLRVSRVQVILNEAIDTAPPSSTTGNTRTAATSSTGSRSSTLPLLDDRPDLQDQIRARCPAQNTDSRKKRAWVLRHAIDDTLAGLN